MNFPQITRTHTDQEMDSMFGAQAWIVGGRVRDEFRAAQRGEKIISKDHDYLVTGRSYEQIVAILKRAGWSADLVGASFGVIKGRKGDLEVDVAIPRKEQSTGDGHKDFSVEFGPHISIEDDLGRRDITWNAGAVNVRTGEIKAAPETLNDLETGKIRVISSNSIPEDPLRMLRIIQFSARFDGTIEAYTREQIQKYAHLLSTIPGERVQEELNKLMLKSADPAQGWRLMADLGILQYVVPELVPAIGMQQNKYHDLDVWNHGLRALSMAAKIVKEGGLGKAETLHGGDKEELKTILIWGAFLHDFGKPETARDVEGYGKSFHGHEHVGASMARRRLAEMKFSDFMIKSISTVIDQHMYAHQDLMKSPGGMRRFLRNAKEMSPLEVEVWWEVQSIIRKCDSLGKTNAVWRAGNDNEKFYNLIIEEMTRKPALSVSDLNINGPAVIDIIIKNSWESSLYRGGPPVGTAIGACLDAVVDEPEKNTPEKLMEIATEHLSSNYYINDMSKVTIESTTHPDIMTFDTGRDIVHIGNVPNKENGLPRGGFLRFERNGEARTEMRGVMPSKMAHALAEIGVNEHDMLTVLATMESGLVTPTPLNWKLENGTSPTIEVSIINPYDHDVQTLVKSSDNKTVTEHIEKGLPVNSGPLIYEMLAEKPELQKQHIANMTAVESFTRNAKKAKREVEKVLKNTQKEQKKSSLQR